MTTNESNRYRDAKLCIAYLSDVYGYEPRDMSSSLAGEFSESAWFERGWMLQGLIAPREVWFFNRAWSLLGLRSQLAGLIAFETRIHGAILAENGVQHLPSFSVGARLA